MMSSADSAAQTIKVVSDARHTNREARKTVNAWSTNLVRPDPSERAQEMLRLLGSQERFNLKTLVLELIRLGADSRDALDQTLKALSELFKQLRIEVDVKASGTPDTHHRD